MRSEHTNLARVAIVGKPNVGKSTLFNRLIRQRKTITDPTPGVTRDPIHATWETDNFRVLVTDTGGITQNSEGFDPLVSKKSMEIMEQSNIILFLLDVLDFTAEDEEILDSLRRFQEKTILILNKVDNKNREDDIWNFYSLGFEQVIAISASHGLGIDELYDAIEHRVEKLDISDIVAIEDPYDLHLAILGKPNTGKSTLLNALTDSENSIVSEIPGTTRDVVEGEFLYKDKRIKILDTAGIRRKKKVQEDVEYYSVNRAIKTIDEADVIFLMVDVVEGLSEQDKKIASLIVKKGKGVIIIMNKWDMLDDIPNQLQAQTDRIRFLFPILEFAPVLPLSALKQDGIKELLNKSINLQRQLHVRIDTGPLNRYIEKLVEINPPPYGKTKRFKVRYMTQVQENPLRFVLFVNRKKGFPQSYIQFIRNRIRKEFALQEVPIIIELRES